MVLRDRLELPPPDYKTGILPHEITELKLAATQGFEPRLRPYEWNELYAVSYPCQDHFLRVLTITLSRNNLVPLVGFEPTLYDF